MQGTIQVVNPCPGDASIIRLRKAKAAVRSQHAAWEVPGVSIRIVRMTDRQIAEHIASREQELGYDKDVRYGKMATMRQLRGLPMNNPHKVMYA
jgi:hypothetical protein